MSFADSLYRVYDDEYSPIIKSFTVPDKPPPKPTTPRLFSWAWFKAYKPPLPPRFQGPFPYNIVRIHLYIPTSRIIHLIPQQVALILLPILFPAFVGLSLVRLSISSRHSRERIKLLEAEDASTAQRLVHIFGQLEREVEDMVVDIVEDANTSIPSQESTKDISKKSPRISTAQRKMVAALNSLPQLKKERVYIPNMRNSHATIVARDVTRFEFHKIGEGVLRHWADAFVM
jgi:hypothetical protein